MNIKDPYLIDIDRRINKAIKETIPQFHGPSSSYPNNDLEKALSNNIIDLGYFTWDDSEIKSLLAERKAYVEKKENKVGQYSLNKKVLLYMIIILTLIIIYSIFKSESKINKSDIDNTMFSFPTNLPGGV